MVPEILPRIPPYPGLEDRRVSRNDGVHVRLAVTRVGDLDWRDNAAVLAIRLANCGDKLRGQAEAGKDRRAARCLGGPTERHKVTRASGRLVGHKRDGVPSLERAAYASPHRDHARRSCPPSRVRVTKASKSGLFIRRTMT
jgi:hypothetical protein